MRHRPHLYLPGPWAESDIEISPSQRSHMERVLRITEGASITYTDGVGSLGVGGYEGGRVARGDEETRERVSTLEVAVAPPKSRDRQRFLVEKLQELGVARIRWLRTSQGEGRVPQESKAELWAIAALEQSRGVWKTVIDTDFVGWDDLKSPVVICRGDGRSDPPMGVATIAIGPEGGWDDHESQISFPAWSLGASVLRVETAAIVAVSRLTGVRKNP